MANPREGQQSCSHHHRTILFYRYAALPAELLPTERSTQIELCTRLGLSGRVLIASEGINGTLAGERGALQQYCDFLATHAHFGGVPIDFKWSDVPEGTGALFADIYVKIAKEIVSYSLDEDDSSFASESYGGLDGGGEHLTPAQWHAELQRVGTANTANGSDTAKETIVVDVRNRYEYAIGHFAGAVDPGMKETSQWKRWVETNAETLKTKRVMLYCTGGIRCEKASRTLLRHGVSDVAQLQGGIHRYLELYGREQPRPVAVEATVETESSTTSTSESSVSSYFQGQNFVFDARVVQPLSALHSSGATNAAASTSAASSAAAAPAPPPPPVVVGRCCECAAPSETLRGFCVCTVCAMLVVVCESCCRAREEYYCAEHAALREMYCTFIERFETPALEAQCAALTALWRTIAGTPYERQQASAATAAAGGASAPACAGTSATSIAAAAAKRSSSSSGGVVSLLAKAETSRSRNRRRTLLRKIREIDAELAARASGSSAGPVAAVSDGVHCASAPLEVLFAARRCRVCGERGCGGRCWGVWRAKKAKAT